MTTDHKLFSFVLVPEGLSPPFVSGGAGQPVVVAWSVPSSPNGVILNYTVERREEGSSEATPTIVGTLPGSALTLVIGDRMTTPFTLYSYRVVAENGAGALASGFTSFLTQEAGMANNQYLPYRDFLAYYYRGFSGLISEGFLALFWRVFWPGFRGGFGLILEDFLAGFLALLWRVFWPGFRGFFGLVSEGFLA